MEFRDLKRQYEAMKEEIDEAINNVICSSHFIMGQEVTKLEQELAEFAGVKHCISCANGTDALQLALMAWNISECDAVFVPDFTFFSSAEVVSAVGATPIFVNVDKNTYNISSNDLLEKIEAVLKDGILVPKAIIAVDLFGLPADYPRIREIANEYKLLVLEDAAQGFGGNIDGKRACSFGDISTTSFFPAKPLGCYGDGGAVFTNNDEWAQLIKSYRIHGKGTDKYDNIRIGMNSRLDTMQAAILRVKLKAFVSNELECIQRIAALYTEELSKYVVTPFIPNGYYSSYAQYTIRLHNAEERGSIQKACKEEDVPTTVYYSKPMHCQTAFQNVACNPVGNLITEEICDTVLSLPFHPYMQEEEVKHVCNIVKKSLK